MSLIRNGYAVSTHRGFSRVLFSALLALAVFDPRAVPAQEVKQIKLTEKHLQGLIGAHEEMAKVYEGGNVNDSDPNVEAQSEAVYKSISEAEKKEDLAQLEAALKGAKPIAFKENIALVLKYFDKLLPLMQVQGPAD
jgi:hypothetical protein